jgi:hypothetical protein
MDVLAGCGTWTVSTNSFRSFGEMAEWLSSDVFSMTLKVSLNRAKDSTWMCWLGAVLGR